MKPPEVVVFDLGKVLVDFDYHIVAERLKSRGSISIDDAVTRLEQSPLLVEFETGRITSREFYQRVQAMTGYTGTYEEFAIEFGDIFSPIEEMVAWHARLRAMEIPTFIFSNTNDLAVSHIHSNFEFFRNFDDYVYSYKVGSMKPHERIYEEVEKVTDCSGNRILYIDDKLENVEAGRNRQWRVIHHQHPEATLKQAAAFGMRVD